MRYAVCGLNGENSKLHHKSASVQNNKTSSVFAKHPHHYCREKTEGKKETEAGPEWSSLLLLTAELIPHIICGAFCLRCKLQTTCLFGFSASIVLNNASCPTVSLLINY